MIATPPAKKPYTFAQELSHQLIARYYSERREQAEFADRVWRERDIVQKQRNIDRFESWRIRLWCILNLNSPRQRSG